MAQVVECLQWLDVLSVPGDYTTLSCTTPIAPAACGKDTNITIFRMKAFCCDMEQVWFYLKSPLILIFLSLSLYGSLGL